MGDALERWARQAPERNAIVIGQHVAATTYRELHERSLRLARTLREWGLRRGDGIAIVMENRREYLEIAWAAQRSGLYYTAINWHLQPSELTYIVNDCAARVVFTSAMVADTVAAIAADAPAIDRVVNVDGALHGATAYGDAVEAGSTEPLAEPCEGCELLYSSGTTGRPKAVKRPLPPVGEVVVNHHHAKEMYRDRYGVTPSTVYLSPAPLYHSA